MTTKTKDAKEQKDPKDDVIRTKKYGCFELQTSPAWGKVLCPVDDPRGEDISIETLQSIRLPANFPRVPSHLWTRIITLYFHYCNPKVKTHGELEVSIVFLRSEDFKRWKVIVPTQEVSGGSVEAKFENSCDIETGEEYTQFPPRGWVHAGSSHSHNTMGAFFSHTDDENELGVPGLHIVVGRIDQDDMTYEYKASIVLRKMRKTIDLTEVVDHKGKEHTFHENVLKYITVKKSKKMRRGRPHPGSNIEIMDEGILGDKNGLLDLDGPTLQDLIGGGPDDFSDEEALDAWLNGFMKEKDKKDDDSEGPKPTTKVSKG